MQRRRENQQSENRGVSGRRDRFGQWIEKIKFCGGWPEDFP
jgi:hypothetical protein